MGIKATEMYMPQEHEGKTKIIQTNNKESIICIQSDKNRGWRYSIYSRYCTL